MNDGLRIDKWLWYARFCKTRSLAKTLCAEGRVLINGEAIQKPNRLVRVGDTLVVTLGPLRRTLIVKGLSSRRARCLRRLYYLKSRWSRSDLTELRRRRPCIESQVAVGQLSASAAPWRNFFSRVGLIDASNAMARGPI